MGGKKTQSPPRGGERRKWGEESGYWANILEREVRFAWVKLVGREQQEENKESEGTGLPDWPSQGFQNGGQEASSLDAGAVSCCSPSSPVIRHSIWHIVGAH